MRTKTSLSAFLLALVLFIVANYYSYLRMGGSCDDCFVSFGFPFPLWEEGGFVTVKYILWSGLIADLYLALSAGFLLGWVLKKARNKRHGIESAEL